MSQEVRGTLYNWDEGTVRELVYANGLGGTAIWNQSKPMPPELSNGGCRITDASTGETVEDILAYDDARGVVDRLQKDADGKILLSASGGVAIVTEFRRLKIEMPVAA